MRIELTSRQNKVIQILSLLLNHSVLSEPYFLPNRLPYISLNTQDPTLPQHRTTLNSLKPPKNLTDYFTPFHSTYKHKNATERQEAKKGN